MSKPPPPGEKRPEEIRLEGDRPGPDYLSYKEMMLAMLRHAPTNTGWLSVLVTFLFLICGMLSCSLVFSSFR